MGIIRKGQGRSGRGTERDERALWRVHRRGIDVGLRQYTHDLECAESWDEHAPDGGSRKLAGRQNEEAIL